VQRHQCAVAQALLAILRAGRVNDPSEIGSVQCRTTATATCRRAGHERSGRVPARRSASRKLGIEVGQNHSRVTPKERADDPDESLDRQQAGTSRRARDHRRRLPQQAGEQIDILD
jgi:hypothetical protein